VRRVIQAGDHIHNSVTGEDVTFLEVNSLQTRARFTLPPHAQGVFLHVHTTFTETFQILEGRLDMIVGEPKYPFVLHAGQRRTVPLRAVHRFWNSSDQPVVFEVEVLPARHLAETLDTLFALANAGGAKADGSPRGLFDLAIIGQLSESYLPGPPVWLQRAVFAVIAGIARVVGHQTVPPRRQPST
jgi:mannose-6-phosphate isomerase-like protein (cupin superfamily)